jgi:acyl carrier protein phosphodiesterase
MRATKVVDPCEGYTCPTRSAGQTYVWSKCCTIAFMNYLAHAFLGRSSPGEMVGQLLADEIKGRNLSAYPLEIQRGIVMHRWVDSHTDSTPALDDIKTLWRPHLGRITGIALDVTMDYYLSIHWQQYIDLPLADFIREVYIHLAANQLHWHTRGRFRLEKMIEQDWLSRYARLDGIALTMNQMAMRNALLKPLLQTPQLIDKHNITIEKCFHLLIHELIVGYQSKINTFATLPPLT